jgi:cytochrome c-type biogenesis protein CcmE
MSKGFQVAAGATLIALLLGWYAATNLEEGASFAYYQTLDEFVGSPDAHSGRNARVHGYVSIGSIERDVAARSVRFTVQNQAPHAGGSAAGALPVLFASLETPDLFKEGAEVVIEGRLAEDAAGARFHADKVFAKCPSKFEGQAAGVPSDLPAKNS